MTGKTRIMANGLWIALCMVLLAGGMLATGCEEVKPGECKCVVPSKQTEKEILAVADEMDEAYTKKNIKKVMSLFTSGKRITVIGALRGDVCRGRKAIRKALKRDFARIKVSTYRRTWTRVSACGDIAWLASGIKGVVKIKGGKKRKYNGRQTMVLRKCKKDGRWKIIQSHYSLPTWMPKKARIKAKAKAKARAKARAKAKAKK
ncbi:MAG: nuclear transport factor 2 family protein [Phycisphaerae bacterium]|nr:nuclear transport factor 2 family protein [Phycisphaerae bacterium]